MSISCDAPRSGYLYELDLRHIRPGKTGGLGPHRVTERHCYAPLNVIAGWIKIRADLLTRQDIERVIIGERRQIAVLRDPEIVQRRELRRTQPLAEPVSAPRGLRELRSLNRPVMELVLELHKVAQLRKRRTERLRHHAVGRGWLKVPRHTYATLKPGTCMLADCCVRP